MFQYFIISIFQYYLITCGLILSESGTLGLTGIRPLGGVIGVEGALLFLGCTRISWMSWILINWSVVDELLALLFFVSRKKPRMRLIPRLSLSMICKVEGIEEDKCVTVEATLSLPNVAESTTTPSRMPSWKMKSDLKLSNRMSPLWKVVSVLRSKE